MVSNLRYSTRWQGLCRTGMDEDGCDNELAEFYDPATKSWQIKLSPVGQEVLCGQLRHSIYPEAGSPCYGRVIPFPYLYTRMHLNASGLIASVGSGVDDRGFMIRTLANGYGQEKLCRDIMGHQFYCREHN